MAAVLDVLDDFRAAVLAAEAQQMAELANRWRAVVGALEAQLNALAHELAEKRRTGKLITQALLYREERYRLLLFQAREEYAKYAEWAEGVIGNRVLRTGEAGAAAAVEALRALRMETAGPGTLANGLTGNLSNVLDADAVNKMVAGLQRDAPLGRLLDGIFPEAADRMGQELINGLAMGLNPREIAQRMAEGFGLALERAMLIARTEALRAYRESTREQYKATGVVKRYKRIASASERTCIACLVADGTIYEIGQSMPEHPNGRCSLVPVVDDMPPLVWEPGREWFERQDEDTQRRILGPRRFDLWKDGRIDLDKMARIIQSAEWGDSIGVTPIRDLI